MKEEEEEEEEEICSCGQASISSGTFWKYIEWHKTDKLLLLYWVRQYSTLSEALHTEEEEEEDEEITS